MGTICKKVFPEVIPPIKGYNCGLIPIRLLFGRRSQNFALNLFLHLSRTYIGSMRLITYTVKIWQTFTQIYKISNFCTLADTQFDSRYGSFFFTILSLFFLFFFSWNKLFLSLLNTFKSMVVFFDNNFLIFLLVFSWNKFFSESFKTFPSNCTKINGGKFLHV